MILGRMAKDWDRIHIKEVKYDAVQKWLVLSTSALRPVCAAANLC
ncbi:hypothetical protein Rleg_4240 [Rhizobium leguminosarum bv. trifolii WSM1325]|uniref:Uncharacterized protein n=1 Tax=Rhizobium leguminosarum bv. trifolii (strain WSM1325) TaxID=395491 RepID=C6B072_RHILS|nr:hypothetical protein Rleg_4240 [Rhizobium leguminosarum bv. trifolii WSM1325]